MENIKQESFLLYLEHSEFVEQLSDAQAGELFKGLFKYAATGETPEFSGIVKMAFIAIRQDLDRNKEKYEQKCLKLRQNGMKGGRPRKERKEENELEEKNEIKENNSSFHTKNQMVFLETKKTYYDNDNDNDNVLSLYEENSYSKRDERSKSEKITPITDRVNSDKEDCKSDSEPISKEEREILENYVKRNNLATKNISAYVRKIIENGDHKAIIERARGSPKKSKEEIIQEELASIHDKRSAGRVLYKYYANGVFPPAEFDEIAEKYKIDTYDKLYNAFCPRDG